TSGLFLAFGRPVSDYLRGAAGNENGTRRWVKPSAIEFPTEVVWSELAAFTLELEDSAAPPVAEPAGTPSMASFLSPPVKALATGNVLVSRSASTVALGEAVSLPRVDALPLRPRVVFGAPPESAKAKAVPAKPSPAAKLAAPAPVAKAIPAPRPAPPPVQKVDPKVAPPVVKATPAPIPVGKAPGIAPPPAPKAAPAKVVAAAKTAVPKVEPVEPPPPAPVAAPSFGQGAAEPHLAIDSPSGGRVLPKLVKFGAPVLLLGGLAYYFVGGSGSGTNTSSPAVQLTPIGSEGWVEEKASDVVGVRRYRTFQLYRQSKNVADYQFSFSGQIQSKALGWVFRVSDTKNYYAMKLEQIAPGQVAFTRFAVVDGRESSYDQKPLALAVRPDTMFQVKLDVRGPRFSVAVQGQPVHDWIDSRLKEGAVGQMFERDERALWGAINFAFAKQASN
ncbi:MAG: hypothetical protein ACRD96_12815, partial [Bryobacteraceae bacterium]